MVTQGPMRDSWRNHHVHTGAVGQTGIHQRRCFIHVTADGRHDFVDNAHKVGIIMELGPRQMEFPHPFHVNLLRPVHHNFGDGVILQERFDGAVTQNFIADIRYQPGPLASGHHKGLCSSTRCT